MHAQIHDAIRQSHERRELHGSVEMNDISLDALGGQITLGDTDIFGGHAQPRPGTRALAGHLIDRRGHHQPAGGDPEVGELIEPLAAVFEEYIPAGDAKIGGPVADIGRDIGGAYHHQPDTGDAGADNKTAGLGEVLLRDDPGALEQRDAFLQDAPLR